MAFKLPELPWSSDALAPYISHETIDYHYGKHHNAYVTKLNALVEGTDLESQSLEELIKTQRGGVFNNAAQVWNHSFYWNCLAQNAGGEPEGDLLTAINDNFGSFAQFKDQFTQVAATQFGSGWAWLCKTEDGKLEILSTTNAENPMTNSKKPILTCDVWEHAYYVDYRNARPKYIEAFWNLVNWGFVSENL